MPMMKLTLSADPEVVASAKPLATEAGTSLSAMFGRWVQAAVRENADEPQPGPLTSRARGLVHLPPGKSDREFAEEALVGKYER